MSVTLTDDVISWELLEFSRTGAAVLQHLQQIICTESTSVRYHPGEGQEHTALCGRGRGHTLDRRSTDRPGIKPVTQWSCSIDVYFHYAAFSDTVRLNYVRFLQLYNWAVQTNLTVQTHNRLVWICSRWSFDFFFFFFSPSHRLMSC